jgi:hypothetical protein
VLWFISLPHSAAAQLSEGCTLLFFGSTSPLIDSGRRFLFEVTGRDLIFIIFFFFCVILVIAGIGVAAMLIPQSLAYASLATLPPAYGLYTAFVRHKYYI